MKTRRPSRAQATSLRLAQHQAVVTGLLDAAEIKRVVLFRGQDQADHLLIELPARREVADGKDDMAGAGDAKSRIEIGGGEAHGHNLLFAAAVAWRFRLGK